MAQNQTNRASELPPVTMGEGRFADNIVYFARVLRRAGIKVGPGAIINAIEAVGAIGVGSREEFHTALYCVFINRHEDTAVFDEAFRVYWQSRDLVNKMIAMMSHIAPASPQVQKPESGKTRVSDALFANKPERKNAREETRIEVDARFSLSEREVLRQTDFAQMTANELAAAKRELENLVLPMDEMTTRRHEMTRRPRKIDPRSTMRSAFRSGGDMILPKWRQPKIIHPPLVILADISGSMSQYTRMFLHFLHVMTEKRRRVHTFLFGTRLTNITRQMRHRDPDEAVALCTTAVKDWSGGTRIGETLEEFNRLWSRRVLGQGAIVLLITDGLERDGIDVLERQMERLHRSCRRLIWLNPLLRFDGFEARARGVRAMLPHVDEFRAVHNLAAMSDLAEALSARNSRGADPRRFVSPGETKNDRTDKNA